VLANFVVLKAAKITKLEYALTNPCIFFYFLSGINFYWRKNKKKYFQAAKTRKEQSGTIFSF